MNLCFPGSESLSDISLLYQLCDRRTCDRDLLTNARREYWRPKAIRAMKGKKRRINSIETQRYRFGKVSQEGLWPSKQSVPCHASTLIVFRNPERIRKNGARQTQSGEIDFSILKWLGITTRESDSAEKLSAESQREKSAFI